MSTSVEVSEHLQSWRLTDELELFGKKKNWDGGLTGIFEKTHGTFLVFHSRRRWVGSEFEKSIKKVPAPRGICCISRLPDNETYPSGPERHENWKPDRTCPQALGLVTILKLKLILIRRRPWLQFPVGRLLDRRVIITTNKPGLQVVNTSSDLSAQSYPPSHHSLLFIHCIPSPHFLFPSTQSNAAKFVGQSGYRVNGWS